MLRFVARLSLVALPVALLYAAELIVPARAVTFRAWEELVVRLRLVDTPLVRIFPYTTLAGPLLPDARVTRVEEGDLGHHTPMAERRTITWVTDSRGYRASSGVSRPELVLVGDSEALGTGLSQEDTLAMVLREEHGLGAYPYAPTEVSDFFAEPRFRERPPRFVVLECVERSVLGRYQRLAPHLRKPREVLEVRSEVLRAFEVALNRLAQGSLLGFLRARVNGRPQPIAAGGMLFLAGRDALEPPAPGEVAAAADTLARVAALARERGIDLAVLVVPDKETIYADLFPGAPPISRLADLREALARRGVDALELERPFREARARGDPPFLRDDTHWSRVGVRIAGEQVARWVATREDARRARLRRLFASGARPDVVMLGDSLTEEGEWWELLERSVANRGISGEAIDDVRARVSGIAAIGPRVVFVLAGVNDLSRGVRPEEVARRLSLLVRELRAALPGTRVVVQSILPVQDDLLARRGLSLRNATVSRTNALLASAREGAEWLDLWPDLSGADGQIAPAYTTDGMHLSAQGYRAWAGAVRSFLGAADQ